MRRNQFLFLFFLLATAHGTFAYNPPIGVPSPATSWGTLDPIDTLSPTARTYAPGWFEDTPRANSMATGDAHDCYYIDNSAAGATDSSNTYGYPGHPRLTVPNIVYSAGSYVEIHGDGATGSHIYSTSLDPRGAGTDINPIWFVGVDSPLFTGKLDFGASSSPHNSYMIFDGLHYKGARIDIRPRFTGNAFDHICIRNCDLNGSSVAAIGSGISVGVSSLGDPTETVQDVVVYNCDIYNYGDKDNPNEECGIYPVFYLTRLWVLDSRIHDVAEDGLAGSHGGQRTSSGYYIGRNKIYDNLTNAFDIKQYGPNVIISQNTVWGQYDVWAGGVHKSSGQGETAVFHYSGDSTGAGHWRDSPADVSFIFNTVYDSRFGISTSQCEKLRVIGNVFYNVVSAPTNYSNLSNAINLGGIHDDTWIVNNTFYGCDGGIRVTDGPLAYNPATKYFHADTVLSGGKAYVCIDDNGDAGITGIDPSVASHWKSFRVQIWGNVIAGRTNPAQEEIRWDSSSFATAAGDEDYNDASYPTGGEFRYGSTISYDLAWMQANTPFDSHSINSNPVLAGIQTNEMLINAATDFQLSTGSPAIDSSTEGTGTSAYASFQSLYGLSIKVDRDGRMRPSGSGWDMGANEFSSDGSPPQPPQNLKVGP